ncbi:MAG TPA: hypothetical protein ENH23_02160 [candidate division Zixibacteria bacterium]|nr:hypothetical protein [candidate division Zixibacteria bacterium]
MNDKTSSNDRKFYVVVGAVVFIVIAVFIYGTQPVTISTTCRDGSKLETTVSEGFLIKYLSNTFSISFESQDGNKSTVGMGKKRQQEVTGDVQKIDALTKAEMMKRLDDKCLEK